MAQMDPDAQTPMEAETPKEMGEEATNQDTAAQEIAALQAERDQYKALAQRTQADFINYRRRMEEEREVLVRNATNGLVTRLLPVLDDMQRAIEALPEDAPPSWGEGVRMILQNLNGILQSEGVTGYEPAPGEPFDPVVHEAVYYQPAPEHPPGSVLSTVRRGYRTPDRILRPAQVVVVKEPDDGSGPN